MHHQPHIRLVDPHAERIGSHHHAFFSLDPLAQSPRADRSRQARVVFSGRDAVFFQHPRRSQHLGTCTAIHDGASLRVFPQQFQQLGGDRFVFHHLVGNVFPAERLAHHLEILGKTQASADIGRCFSGSGSREGDRGDGEEIPRPDDLAVSRAEVVPPLGDAVRLVHCQKRYRKVARHPRKTLGGDAFGREIQELERPVRCLVEAQGDLGSRKRTVDAGRRDSFSGEGFHLVFHQGDERGDDQRYPVEQQGRYLIAHRFASAGRQDGQGVPSGQYRFDGLALGRAQTLMSPVVAQEFVGIGGRFHRLVEVLGIFAGLFSRFSVGFISLPERIRRRK